MNSIVIHYQEIALKGKNRPWFITRLVRNLQAAMLAISTCSDVRSLMGRIELVFGPARRLGRRANARLQRRVRHRELLSGTARTHSISTCSHGRSSAIFRGCAGGSFRVAARRADKRFPLPSPDIERLIGGACRRRSAGR